MGCSTDSCREYSAYTCSELEKQRYNVYVYPPDDDEFDQAEYFAGEVTGLSACGETAWSFAGQKGFERSADWSYICCLETDESSCAEKHR
jgi:hypothetical protein